MYICGKEDCKGYTETNCCAVIITKACKDYKPLTTDKDTILFMDKRLPHLLNIADELLTWCIEEDKKGIYKDLLKKYRKEYEDIIEKGI